MEINSTDNKSLYPGFGTVIEDSDKIKFKDVAKKIALFALPIIIGGAVGFAVGNIPGLVIGASAGAIVSLSILSLLLIRRLLYSHMFKVDLPNNNKASSAETMLGKYTEANLLPINRVKKSFEWKKRLIQSAETSIELSGNYAGGDKFFEILEAINERMTIKPELKTHIIISKDLVGKKNLDFLEILKIKFPGRFNCLITDRYYMTLPETHSEENHVKLLIIDEKYFLMGGTGIRPNMARENYDPNDGDQGETYTSRVIMDRCFRDTDLAGEGKIAIEMRKQFFNLHKILEIRNSGKEIDRYFSIDGMIKGNCEAFHEKKSVVNNARMKFIVSGPEHRRRNPITKEILKRIGKAKDNIKIANLFFIPDVSIKKALKQKKKNTDVIITYYGNGLTEGIQKIIHSIFTLTARPNYHLTTTTYEYKIPGRLYHKKVTTFDDSYTMIGTYNFSKKSAQYDYEITCLVKNEKVTKAYNKGLDEDALNSDKITSPSSMSLRRYADKVIGIIPNLASNYV